MAGLSEQKRFKEKYKEYYENFTARRHTSNNYYSKVRGFDGELSGQYLSFGVLDVNTRAFVEGANVLTSQLSGLIAFRRKAESEPESYPYSLVGSHPFPSGGVREIALAIQVVSEDISKLHYQVALTVRDELLDVRINNVPLPSGFHRVAPFDVISFHDSRRERSGHILVPAIIFHPGVSQEDIGKLYPSNYYYRRDYVAHGSEDSRFFGIQVEKIKLDTPEAIRLGFDSVKVRGKEVKIREV
jgi:hypothetical protein